MHERKKVRDERRWFTCIVHNPDHINAVQYFHTRAATPEEAEANAKKWICDGDQWDADKIDVPFVFEGKHEMKTGGGDA